MSEDQTADNLKQRCVVCDIMYQPTPVALLAEEPLPSRKDVCPVCISEIERVLAGFPKEDGEDDCELTLDNPEEEVYNIFERFDEERHYGDNL